MSLSNLRPYLDARLTSLPLLTLHVTESCDSRCVGCSYGSLAGPVLERSTAVELAREAERLNTRVVLVTGGEPLTVPHLEELVRPFVRTRRRLFLATSGTRLPDRAALVADLFDELFVSLDGKDAAHHDSVRGVPTFEALRQGVRSLKYIAPLKITARTTVQRMNIDELPAIVRTSRKLGMDRISFLPVDAMTGAFGRDGSEELSDLLPTAEQIERLEQSLPAIEEELGPELIPNLQHVARYLRAARGEEEWPTKRCNTPLVSAVVRPDGSVLPCFFKEAVGDIADAGLAAALDSESARRVRATLDPATDPDCQRCVCPKYFPLRHLLVGIIR